MLERGFGLLMVVVVVSSTRLVKPAEPSAMAGRARCRTSIRDVEGSVRDGLGVPTPYRHTYTINGLNKSTSFHRALRVEYSFGGKPGSCRGSEVEGGSRAQGNVCA